MTHKPIAIVAASTLFLLAATCFCWAPALRAEELQAETGAPQSPDAVGQPPISEPLAPVEPYPAAPPQMITPAPMAAIPASRHWVNQYVPYIMSAYIPELDRTEVNLGLLLYNPPGIEAGIHWGATPETMMAARMTVQSASYTAGFSGAYSLRNEQSEETKPAIAAALGWRYVSFRTNNPERETIFRGNRLLGGLVFSKALSSFGRALEAGDALQNFLDYFKVHVAVLLEYQTGRQHADEEAFTGFEAGTRSSLELMLDPGKLYFSLTYDSLPDWLGVDNYYLGIRFLPRTDFAWDVLAGKMGTDLGASLGLAWIF